MTIAATDGVHDDSAAPTLNWQLIHAQPGALVYAAPSIASKAHPLLRRQTPWEPAGAVQIGEHPVEHPVLHYAGYVGRVGLLAAALGVGAAVAGNPGIACAQPTGTETTTTTETTTPSQPGQTARTRTPGRVSRRTSTPTTNTTAPTTTPAPATTRVPRSSTALPTVPLRSAPVPASSDSRAAATPTPTAPTPQRVARPELRTPVTEAVQPPADALPATPSVEPATAEAVTPATAMPTQAPAPAPTTEPAAPAPIPAPSTAPARTSRAAVDRISGAIAPAADVADTPAARSVAEWGIFAWVRRTFFNQTPTATYNPATTSQLDDTVTGTVTVADADGDAVRVSASTPTNGGTVTIDNTGQFTYTATPQLAETGGIDSFTVTVEDTGLHIHGISGLINAITFGLIGNSGHSTSTTVTVTVTPVNAAPVAGDPAYTLEAVDHSTGTVPGHLNVTDPDSDTLSYIVAGGPSQGTLDLDAVSGAFSYTPFAEDRHQAAAEDAAGTDLTDTFTVTVDDGRGGTLAVPVSVGIDPINAEPVMTIGDITDPDIAGTVTVSVTTIDADNDTITYLVVNSPAHGSVTYDAVNNEFVYTPTDATAQHEAAATEGPDYDTFTVEAHDAHTGVATAIVDVEIAATNAAPVANDDQVTTSEDTPVSGNVLTNDIDDDSDTLTVIGHTDPKNGSVTVNDDGSFTYTPEPDFDEVDSFQYTVSDGHGGTSTAAVTVMVTPINDAPVAVDDTAATDEDTPIVIGVLQNDTDIEHESLAVDQFDSVSAEGGAVVLEPDGTFTYTPKADFHGTDTFTYTVTDGTATSNTATVTVTVNPVNDAPVAHDADLSVAEDTPLTGNVLNYVTDVEGGDMTATLHSGVSNGQLTFNSDGSFTYTADENCSGTDSFEYIATDADDADSNTATVHITVNPVNDAPTAADATAGINEDTAVLITPPVSDPDTGDTLTLAATSIPDHGTVAVNPDGTSFTYTPEADWSGTDTFTFQAVDSEGAASNTGTVTVTVTNLPPSAVNDETYHVNEGAVLTVDAEHGVLANDTDPGGGTLTAQWVGGPAFAAAFTLNPDGSFNYTPTRGRGTDFFAYRAIDSQGAASDVAFVRIDTHNLLPVSTDDVDYHVDEDTTLTIDAEHGVLANDTDPGGGGLTTFILDHPTHAEAFTLNADGSFTYSPAPNWSGVDGFTYWAVDDETEHGNIASVTVTVNPVDDVPAALDDSYTTAEDTPLTGNVLANDTDIDTPHDALRVWLASPPNHGQVVLAGDGSFTYTPAADYNGTDTFTYAVADTPADLTTSNPATVTVSITPVNDAAPTINSVSSTPGVGNTWTVTPTVTDVDPEDVVVVTVSAGDTDHVTVSDVGGGHYTVTVTDTAWAAANPGHQLLVVVTATDNHSAPVTTTMAIGTVNNAAAIGYDGLGQTAIPALPAGVTYTQAAAGATHTVLLRSDGTAIAIGGNNSAQLNIPPLDSGVTYTQVAAGSFHTVLLRSDGTAVAVGSNSAGQADIPPGSNYVQVAAGANHTVLLRSDGTAVAFGDSYYGQTAIPSPPTGATYTQVAAGGNHTVLLCSDGTVVAIGYNEFHQTEIPAPPPGVVYTQVAAGGYHTVLLRSDGQAVAVGRNYEHQLDVPALPPDVTYTQVAAGWQFTSLLRSDGTVSSFGSNVYGQNNIPVLPVGAAYTTVAPGGNHNVLLSGTISGRPVAVADEVSTSEDMPLVIGSTTLLGNDSDPSGQPLRIISVSQANHGITAMASDGTITYTPNTNYNGTDSFSYTVSDGGLADAATVAVTVNPVNDAPVVTAGALSTPDAATGAVSLTVTAGDADGDPLTISTTTPTQGTVDIIDNHDGTWTVTYDPTDAARLHAGLSPETETDDFTITATDGHDGEITLAITDVPISPTHATAAAPISLGTGYPYYWAYAWGVAFSPDGNQAYVANRYFGVTVIDTESRSVTAKIPAGSTYGLAVSPDGSRVYLATADTNTVSVIDTASNSVIDTNPTTPGTQGIAVGSAPYSLAVSPDGGRVYVANAGSNTVSVIDTATYTVVDTDPATPGMQAINVGSAPQGIAVSPDGSRVYVANAGSDNVTAIDTATFTVIGDPIPVGASPLGIAVADSSDGNRVYVTNSSSNTVSAIDTATNTVTTITVGSRPYGVVFSPDGTLAYVTNAASRTVSVIDTATNTVVGDPIPVYGDTNLGLALSPDGTLIYVTNHFAGASNQPAEAVSVISIT